MQRQLVVIYIALFSNGTDTGKCGYCVVSDTLAFLLSFMLVAS